MDGILIVDKEKGFTSHDVVAKLRGILHQKKIGHTGTLDPDATGVLPVCIGKATKVCDVLTDRDKEYIAEVVLGITTDTLDTSGKITNTYPVDITEDELTETVGSFLGEITQIPPMYSAIKVNGKKLYEYAREGVEVERKKRTVIIHEIEILDRNIFPYKNETTDIDKLPSFKMRVRCSKGTYIRTLCDDIGAKLGCRAAMKSLVRTAVGPFDLSNAKKLDDIEHIFNDNNIEKILIPTDAVFDDYPACEVSEDAIKLLENGNPLKLSSLIDADKNAKEGDIVRVYLSEDFYALYKYDLKNKRYKVHKYFH